MKCHQTYLVVIILLVGLGGYSYGQGITDVYSENLKYYARTVPFDSEYWSALGKTYVLDATARDTLYTIDRNFGQQDNLHLSNDGRTLIYTRNFKAIPNKEENQFIIAYRDGKLVRSYGVNDLFSCNNDTEDCQLLFYSGIGYGSRDTLTRAQAMERLGNDYNPFAKNDTLYLINPKYRVFELDLNTGELLRNYPLDSAVERLDTLKNKHKTEYTSFMDSFSRFELPEMVDGRSFHQELGKLLKLKAVDMFEKGSFRKYQVHVDVLIGHNGKPKLNELEVDDELPKDEIETFLKAQTFKMDLPVEFEEWRFTCYYHYRRHSRIRAQKEKRLEQQKRQAAFDARLEMDSIGSFYIPKNLEDCYTQLDSMLRTKDRDTMKALTNADGMSQYHMGLGRYLRNNWSLWGGSRLAKYFYDLGIYHPDDMSGIILTGYYHYLNGTEFDLDGEIAHYRNYWEMMAIPTRKYRPSGARSAEFNTSKPYNFNGEERSGQIHFQTNSKSDKTWIYDNHYGWKKLTEQELDTLDTSKNKKEVLDSLFGK